MSTASSDTTPAELPTAVPDSERQPPDILVADVAVANHRSFRNFGIPDPPQWLSWAPERRDDTGWPELLREAGLSVPPDPIVVQASISVVSPESLEGFFAEFLRQIRSLPQLVAAESPPSQFVLINLIPLNLCITLMDRIVSAMKQCHRGVPFGPTSHLVLLLRNVDLLLKSHVFKEALSRKELHLPFSAIDIRGYGATFDPNGAVVEFEVGRSSFSRILPVAREKVYRSLVFDTNSFLGHFILSDSHARTHYDLSEFVGRDDVTEYLVTLLSPFLRGKTSALFVATGIEEDALRKTGEYVLGLFAGRLSIRFHYTPDPGQQQEVIETWSERYDVAIALGDIVNSGTTLARLLRALKEHNPQTRPIHAFTVVRMQNSPDSLEGIHLETGAVILRDYYAPDVKKCPLCLLNQPAVQVASARDFRVVSGSQLTPLDFWELVADSKALRVGKSDSQDRRFAFRVDTTPVIKRYHRWLANVIGAKYRAAWPKTLPHLLCTVAREPGVDFANVASRALSGRPIVAIPRDVLRTVTPTSRPLPELAAELSKVGERVLIVDDGINYGGTIAALIMAVRASGGTPMGVLVLDSRLDERATNRLRLQMSNSPVVALYNWPSPTSQL